MRRTIDSFNIEVQCGACPLKYDLNEHPEGCKCGSRSIVITKIIEDQPVSRVFEDLDDALINLGFRSDAILTRIKHLERTPRSGLPIDNGIGNYATTLRPSTAQYIYSGDLQSDLQRVRVIDTLTARSNQTNSQNVPDENAEVTIGPREIRASTPDELNHYERLFGSAYVASWGDDSSNS